jgi:hypothetical protein
MSQFAAAFCADLQSVPHLFGQRAVGKRTSGSRADGQGRGDGLGHLVGGATPTPAERGFALGVDGGDDQPADQADVGQERAPFVGLRCGSVRSRVFRQGFPALPEASAADATPEPAGGGSCCHPHPALTRVTVSAWRNLCTDGIRHLLRPSSVARAASAAGLGLRRASMPRLMKTADNIGRAIRLINMGPEFPRPTGRKP